ncbi:MAG: potassium transporter [Opitutaceae bacterium]|jgi:monovalent cation:proton antiporter-2 (CPA2) family protein|nr:potassium transporter [Opitutaceae bacterium]
MANQSLFVAVFVYLLAAVISVAIAKRVGLSAVLGYLVAGMAIGPFGLGLVGEEGQDVMHFAEFGVVMMLFLIGLELRPSLLWRLRGPILGLGGGQVVLTAAAIFGIAAFVGLTWQMALAIGLALALSSTAIVLQGLQEKNLSNTSGGRSAFSVLLFQDIAVIPMLAIFPLLATLTPAGAGDGEHGHGASAFQDWLAHQPSWVNTLLVLGAVVAIILAGRYVVQPVLRLVAGTRVREAFVALALLLVIGIALLMSSLGVSAALGTFLAGVVLADSEYRHELEADIEPFKGLLLGVFFIAVGASVDFALIAQQPGVVAAVVVGLMVLKAVILLVLGAFGKLKLDQRFLFALSLAQGSEFAFVLLGFGITEGVIATEVAQILIASVALTMALTPLVMVLEERVIRPRFGTKTTNEKEPDEMDEDSPVILAGIGRFGNFVARMLRAQKIDVTVIDHDSDHIDFLRKLGILAFYGDANRHDLLEAAGAHKAKLLIITLGDEDKVTELIATTRKHFPHLKILVRALSRPHHFELINDGITRTVHQHAGSAIELARGALEELGYRAHRANRLAQAFAKFDREAATKIAAVHKDENAFATQVRRSISEMEDQFEEDRQSIDPSVDDAWDNTKLRENGVRS